MKNLLIGLFCFISYPNLFSQTSSDVEKIAKNGLEQKIASESQGALKLINFKKIDGKASDFSGESIYDLKFQIEIEVVKSYYLNTGLFQPFVGVQGSGWKYFECTTQGEGFLYKVRLTIGQKYSLVGNATLIENTDGYYFSGYEITSHKEVSGASSISADENKPTFQASTSKDVYCKYDIGYLVGVNEQYKKYVGYWANKNNECFAIKYEEGVFKIFMDCSYNPETQATFTTTDVQADIEVGPQISFHIDTSSYTLIYKNDCYLMSRTKYEKPLKSNGDLLYYDVKLNSDKLSRSLFSLKYTDNSYYNESIYPRYRLKNDVLAYLDSSERFNVLNEKNNSSAKIVFNVDFNIVIYALQTNQGLYKGGARIEIIVKNMNNAIIDSSMRKIETGFLNEYKTEKDAIIAIINKIEKPIYLAIWSCFPVNTQIVEILERDKKGNAKTVKINAGREMGVFENFQFRIEDAQISNSESKNKGQLQVISVNEDGTSTCKVIGQSDTITKTIDSGKFISVTTIYDAVE